jgi:hypothetical protein
MLKQDGGWSAPPISFSHIEPGVSASANFSLRHLDAGNSSFHVAGSRLASNPQASGKAIVLPAIPELTSKAESFLQAAKLALQLRIVGPVVLEKHGPKVGNFGFNFKELGKWCDAELGATNILTQMALHAEPWVKQIVDMRNVVDHPRDSPRKRLIVKDFTFVLGGAAPFASDCEAQIVRWVF